MNETPGSEMIDRRGVLMPVGSLTVANFKSIDEDLTLDIADLTVLCGANSSGKSSFMQVFLLLKQTLEADFDPGPLLIDGDLASFSFVEEMIPWRQRTPADAWKMSIGFNVDDRNGIGFGFMRSDGSLPLQLKRMAVIDAGRRIRLDARASELSVDEVFGQGYEGMLSKPGLEKHAEVGVERERFIFTPHVMLGGTKMTGEWFFPELAKHFLRSMICLPGLRDHASRSYPLTATPQQFSGNFHRYTASLLADWGRGGADARLHELTEELKQLGLASRVEAVRINDTRVEVRVSRSPNAKDELVNIADVGIGTSQVLPVLVAVRVARPGQVVYVEQPELHLHPKAQAALAGVLVSAVNRGVRLIIETHSPALLQALQIQIAEGHLDPERARFHWFQRDEEGATKVDSITPGPDGAYGDWPEDFSEADAKLDDRYLDATLFKGLKDAG